MLPYSVEEQVTLDYYDQWEEEEKINIPFNPKIPANLVNLDVSTIQSLCILCCTQKQCAETELRDFLERLYQYNLSRLSLNKRKVFA